MPQIAQYTNKVALDPSPLSQAAHRIEIAGDETGAAVRQGFGSIAQGVDQVEQHLSQNETSKLAADFATAHAKLTTQWNDMVQKADPNDHQLASRFQDEVVGPTIDKLGDGLMTRGAQDMYQKASAGLKADFFEKTTADQSNLAGAAAVANLDTVKNQLSASARTDPAGWQGLIAMAQTTTDGLVKAYDLPREKAIQLSTSVNGEIAKAAAIGMADRNPTEMKAALARGDFDQYLDGTTQKTLASYADQQERAATTAQRAAEVEQKRKDKEDFDHASNTVLGAMLQPDGSLRVPANAPSAIVKMSQMPGAIPGEMRSLIDMTERVTKDHADGKDLQTDPHVYEDFAQRVLLPTSDPRALSMQEVIAARAAGAVNDHDFSFFKGNIDALKADPAKREADKQFNAFLQSQKVAFTQRNFLTGAQDPVGAQRYFQFSQAARQKYEEAYSKGEWQQTLDAKNPAFLGRLAPQYLGNQKGATPSAPVAKIGGDADFAKLPHGAQFVGPDGVMRVKP